MHWMQELCTSAGLHWMYKLIDTHGSIAEGECILHLSPWPTQPTRRGVHYYHYPACSTKGNRVCSAVLRRLELTVVAGHPTAMHYCPKHKWQVRWRLRQLLQDSERGGAAVLPGCLETRVVVVCKAPKIPLDTEGRWPIRDP